MADCLVSLEEAAPDQTATADVRMFSVVVV